MDDPAEDSGGMDEDLTKPDKITEGALAPCFHGYDPYAGYPGSPLPVESCHVEWQHFPNLRVTGKAIQIPSLAPALNHSIQMRKDSAADEVFARHQGVEPNVPASTMFLLDDMARRRVATEVW
eukprot:CAMPEP_0172627908 /NCGR_PEP_ID=MMETSP1068-20121228/158833_1 /TAXON_ID=35684 /ORGANISM="Pseudopedinella elastica, Strain CCMP716" /LENGTH=122 /DNA_ID=CAMNT_0013437931 /DNA_START=15 /DNA_END=380 /DNA_ORIENTATION=+